MKKIVKHRLQTTVFTILIASLCVSLVAQPKIRTQKGWRIAIQRKDGKQIIFQLEKNQVQGKTTLAVVNAGEKINITDVTSAGDSLFFTMPTFEASFRVKVQANGDMTGTFI